MTQIPPKKRTDAEIQQEAQKVTRTNAELQKQAIAVQLVMGGFFNA